MLDASSASGSAQYLLAKIKQASADSIWKQKSHQANGWYIIRLVSQLEDGLHRHRGFESGSVSHLNSGQVVWVQDGSLIKLHLSEVALEQGFQLKIRGNTERKREKLQFEEEHYL